MLRQPKYPMTPGYITDDASQGMQEMFLSSQGNKRVNSGVGVDANQGNLALQLEVKLKCCDKTCRCEFKFIWLH